MVETDLAQSFRFFLIAGIVLASIGTFLYAYHQTKAASRPRPNSGRAMLLCGIALCAVLAILLFQTDTDIISDQEDALQSGIPLSEQKANGPLDDNKLAILSTAIKPFAGMAYDLVAAPCADGSLVMKLNSALSAGQWKFVGSSLPATVASRADAVRIQYSQDSKSAVDTLTAAMKAAGLNVTTALTDSNSADVRPNTIHISIGADSQ